MPLPGGVDPPLLVAEELTLLSHRVTAVALMDMSSLGDKAELG
jgi:hypothetical protein